MALKRNIPPMLIEPGAQARRSPLADPKFGLAWSNSSISDEVLVRAAIKHGAFHMLLEAAMHHGMQFIEMQLDLMLADEDVALSDRAQAEIRRKLANIKHGIAAAELDAQDMTQLESERPGPTPGLSEGRK